MAASSADLDLLVGIVEAAAASEYTLAKSTKEGDRKGGGEGSAVRIYWSTRSYVVHLIREAR